MEYDLAQWIEKLGGQGSCPPEESVSAYLEGKVSRRERRLLERHFRECPLCKGEIEAHNHARNRSILSKRLLSRPALASAAALAGGLLLAGVFHLFSGTPAGGGLLFTKGNVASALARADSWFLSHPGKGGPEKTRFLSRLLDLPLPPETPPLPPRPSYRGPSPAAEAGLRLEYPLGLIGEDRPDFRLRHGHSPALLRLWSLGEGKRVGVSFSLEAPPGEDLVPYPPNRPSLPPGDYAIQVKCGKSSLLSWFRVPPVEVRASLKKEWRALGGGLRDPCLRAAARARFCLARGLEAEALLILRKWDSDLLTACPPARRWLKYLERKLCGDS